MYIYTHYKMGNILCRNLQSKHCSVTWRPKHLNQSWPARMQMWRQTMQPWKCQWCDVLGRHATQCCIYEPMSPWVNDSISPTSFGNLMRALWPICPSISCLLSSAADRVRERRVPQARHGVWGWLVVFTCEPELFVGDAIVALLKGCRYCRRDRNFPNPVVQARDDEPHLQFAIGTMRRCNPTAPVRQRPLLQRNWDTPVISWS